MATDDMEAAPLSPRQSPGELRNAILQWVKGRRGRVIVLASIVMVTFLGLLGMRNSETIASRYHSTVYGISENYHLPSWRPHLPNLPAVIHSPLIPSKTTLELENGDLTHPPALLHKNTPNFHLVMPALTDSNDFCKTTLSAMVLNYPPPTIINLFQTFDSEGDREQATLESIHNHLKNGKLVKDEDLVLIVDGHDTWFQLPSDVIIRQYRNILADANERLLAKYGLNEAGVQKYSQTILFGAEKTCEGEDLACKYAPDSLLPSKIYGKDAGKEIAFTPAKYLDAGMLMGPAKDLRALYVAALEKSKDQNSQARTVQSAMATIFGEQELARSSKPGIKSKRSKWLAWLNHQPSKARTETTNTQTGGTVSTLTEGLKYEFSIGLDYTHTLFQPFINAAEQELVPLPHDNSTDLSDYHHPYTPTPPLKIPTALEQANPPFWTIDLEGKTPTPNDKPSYVEPLAIQKNLDTLKPRDTTWEQVKLVQNTYTGAIPVALHLNLPPQPLNAHRRDVSPRSAAPVPAEARGGLDLAHTNITFARLWFAPYSRALLRNYFRTHQSAVGYHAAAVGGDRLWDVRGGRGGVWTEKNGIWLPWGEIDGVCGSVDQLREVFADNKGVWLHETEDNKGEPGRLKDMEELKKKIKEQKEKEEKKQKEKDEAEKEKQRLEVEDKKKKLKLGEKGKPIKTAKGG